MKDFTFEMKESLSRLTHDTIERIREFLAACADLYLNNSNVRSTADSIFVLGVMVLIDTIAGNLLALRLMYIAPIWLAAQRGGRLPGLILVVATTATLVTIDHYRYLDAEAPRLLHAAVLFGVLYGLMRLIESLESRLQNYAHLATRDALTGVANRVALEEFSKRTIEKSMRTGDALTVVMIDCDKFKELNDEFGHDYGDHVLRTLVKLMRRGVQPTGFVARTGGDEFIVVLPGKNVEEARKMMEKVNAKFMEATVIMNRASSFSFGVARMGSEGISLQELIKAADKDMYLRKAANRLSNMAVVQTGVPEMSA